MLLMWPGKCAVKAKVRGQVLVASFRNSSPPLVWQFDLDKNHSFTAALQGEDGEWELGVTSPRGEFYAIARFTSREDADEAFAKVQRALLRGRCPLFRGWTPGWAVFGLLVFALLLWTGLGLLGGDKKADHAEMPVGVPVPADEFLKPPPQVK